MSFPIIEPLMAGCPTPGLASYPMPPPPPRGGNFWAAEAYGSEEEKYNHFVTLYK